MATSNRGKGRSKPVIGIVGGVGAGKSTAAAEFGRLGCAVIDADAIGHRLLEDPAVRGRIVRRWGREVLGAAGRVNRKALGRLVFGDPRELAALNRILHRLIRRHMRGRIAAERGKAAAAAVVVDAALLLEAGWDDLCTHLVFVSSAAKVRAARAGRWRGWSRSLWRQREKSQIPLDKKRQRCHHILSNSSSVSHLYTQVRRVFHQIVPNAG